MIWIVIKYWVQKKKVRRKMKKEKKWIGALIQMITYHACQRGIMMKVCGRELSIRKGNAAV